MGEFTTGEAIKAVGIAIAQYVFGKAGDKFCDSFFAKHKIKMILKEDEKFIEKQFGGQNCDTVIDIKKFLLQDIFQDAIFLFPVSAIPEDRATLLWERFCVYVKDEYSNIEVSQLEQEYKSKLKACINNHNILVNKFFLSESEKIILKTIQRNQSDLLGYIGKTLDSNSELQCKNNMFDYTHKQIEGILHALRMDMRHYKFLSMIYSMGILIIGLVSIIILPKIINVLGDSLSERSVTMLLTISMSSLFIFALLISLFSSAMKNVHNCEKKISKYMEALWELNFNSYRTQFESLN